MTLTGGKRSTHTKACPSAPVYTANLTRTDLGWNTVFWGERTVTTCLSQARPILSHIFIHVKTQSVPRSKHTDLVIKTSQSVLYREIIAVCSEIHRKKHK
jgi:hypothetical protein